MTNYSRSVLKSNGLRHLKNLPVKFGFSPQIVPANIVQKLPSQRCSKPLLIAFFNFSHKWFTFAFTDESGYTLGFRRKIAHNGLHAETGAFPPPATAGLCVTSEIAPITTFATLDSATLLYTYISRFSVTPHLSAEEKYPAKLPSQLCSKPLFIAFFNFSHKWPTFAFTGESGYTLGFRKKIAHKGTHGETGAFPPSTTVRLCAASEIPFIPPCFYIHTFPGSLWPLTIGRREKVSEDATATLSPTIPHCVFQLRSQMAHVRFHERKWVHTRLRQQDRTQRLTRRNTGPSGRGRYHYPRSVPHVHKHPRAGYQNGVLCRFWVLAGCAPEERRKPSGQRCAYARRCPEASRPRWAA